MSRGRARTYGNRYSRPEAEQHLSGIAEGFPTQFCETGPGVFQRQPLLRVDRRPAPAVPIPECAPAAEASFADSDHVCVSRGVAEHFSEWNARWDCLGVGEQRSGGTACVRRNDLSRELYNSDQAWLGRDHFGAGNKFITHNQPRL